MLIIRVSWEQNEKYHGYFNTEQHPESRWLYKFYPDVLNNPDNEVSFLKHSVTCILTGNFNPLELRTYKGSLWKNYLISESVKKIENKQNFAHTYFWKTRRQEKVDYVEERSEIIYGYESKWNKRKKKVKLPKTFTKTFNAKCMATDKDNFRRFIFVN